MCAEHVDKHFQPSRMGWLSLTRQRMRSKKKQEDPLVVEKFAEMTTIRDNLKKIESAIVKWKVTMNKLYRTAAKLGKAVECDPTLTQEAVVSIELLRKDDTALKNIQEKIKRIDDLLNQRKTLKYIRLKGEYAQHRLDKLRNAGATETQDRTSQKYLTIKKESGNQRDQILSQVLLVIDLCVKETAEFGIAHLVKPQLQSFKMNQFNLFLSIQKLIQGKTEDKMLLDIENQYEHMRDRYAEDGVAAEDQGWVKKMTNLEGMQALSEFSESQRSGERKPRMEEVKGGDYEVEEGDVIVAAGMREGDELEDDEDDDLGDEGSDLEVRKPLKEEKEEKPRQPSVLMSDVEADDDSDFEGDDLSELDDDLEAKI